MAARRTIGAVVAMHREARAVKRAGARCDVSSSLLVSGGGIGAASARSAAHALLDAGAGVLLSVGFAGALDPALTPGDVVLADEVLDEDGQRLPVPALSSLHDEATRGMRLDTGALHEGSVLSVTRVASNASEKYALAARSGACAVDMESFAVACTAAERGVPVVVLRVISDGHDQRVPQVALAGVDAGGREQLAPLLGALLLRPHEMPSLLRLARSVRAAERSLEHALVRLLPSLLRDGSAGPDVVAARIHG